MEKKAVVVAIINGLLSYLLTLKDWGNYIAYGWEAETVITVVIGAIVGVYFAVKHPPKKVIVWLILPVVMIIFLVLYSNLLDDRRLGLWKMMLALLLLLIVMIIGSCILAYFELELLKFFSPKKSATGGQDNKPLV